MIRGWKYSEKRGIKILKSNTLSQLKFANNNNWYVFIFKTQKQKAVLRWKARDYKDIKFEFDRYVQITNNTL